MPAFGPVNVSGSPRLPLQQRLIFLEYVGFVIFGSYRKRAEVNMTNNFLHIKLKFKGTLLVVSQNP